MVFDQVFRQSDAEFIGHLNKFRRGICDEAAVEFLKTCGSDLDILIKIKPTNLYPLRAAVDSENQREYAKIEGPEHKFRAADDYRGTRGEREMATRVSRQAGRETLSQQLLTGFCLTPQLKDTPPVQYLALKTGAQVVSCATRLSQLATAADHCAIDHRCFWPTWISPGASSMARGE